MKSINFEFIRPHQPELATLGGFAEHYAHTDPDSALVKLRNFAEQIVKDIYVEVGLPPLPHGSLFNLISEVSFKRAVPPVVLNKIDSLRVEGNKAAHGQKLSPTAALWILREAWDLAGWYYVAFCGGTRDQLPLYQEPAAPSQAAASDEQARKEKKLAREQLDAQEQQLAQLLEELEHVRAKAQTADRTITELNAALTRGLQAATTLQFDEETTRRRLIDAELVSAGWKVGPQGNSTEQVGQEVEVPHQQLPSGKGYADYVLWGDDGKPLAIIEAKKTSIDANSGREQARQYADGLEREYGQRPIIFYTNGFETYIWNDAMNETPRQIYGFYSKDSMEYLIFQRHYRQLLAQVAPDPTIAGRIYQIEAIRRVTERLTTGHRKGLIVLATGTGKTRVAVSLCQLLLRAGWVKRVLFLCDRKELRKQADNVFKEYLPSEPRVVVTKSTAKDRDKRIYLATYPAMIELFDTFDVGFFDLIIADESHRSIYRRYRDLFVYFDCVQIGLTATPVHLLGRNTYRLFDCEDKDPTAHFDYKDAVEHEPKFLVPFQVFKTTTQFQREGIRYSQMSAEQQQELEESEGEPDAIEFDAAQVDRQVFNKDSNRAILRNLMENGIRDETGSRPGKSIIFARNHNHALLLQFLFDEMYPQYGGNFCRVIDNYDPRAEQLIDDFKGNGPNPGLTIAISVDMLDTGIDIPEVVNLVFAKPVKSYVKFWQMIGRGTRLCPNLFGPGKDKTEFLIFDHWRNFEFFEEKYKEASKKPVKSLLQRLFEARIELAETAIYAQDVVSFDTVIELIARDVADLPDDSLPVREKMRAVLTARHHDILKSFAPITVAMLKADLAPLMQWRDTKGAEAAYKFDLLTTRLQIDKLRGSANFDNLKSDLIDEVQQLPINLNQVRAKEELIAQVKSGLFWQAAGVPEIERVRRELRWLMQYIATPNLPKLPPKVIDVTEDRSQIEFTRHIPKLEGLQLIAYRKRVLDVLRDLIAENTALQKIKAGQPVSNGDLEELCNLVISLHPDVNLRDLRAYYPAMADSLEIVIRSIIGMDAQAVNARFEDFVHRHPILNAKQLRFLELLKNHLIHFGSIEIERLYGAPFTALDSEGIDGIFRDDEQINELLDIIATFNLPQMEENVPEEKEAITKSLQ